MNTLQNVYDKLADKTELAKHEVELSLATDLQGNSKKLKQANIDTRDAVKFIQNSEIEIDNLIKIFEQNLIKVKQNIKRSNDLVNQNATKYKGIVPIVKNLLTKAELNAKELGLDVNSIPSYKELKLEFDTTYTNQTANIENKDFWIKDLNTKISILKAITSKI